MNSSAGYAGDGQRSFALDVGAQHQHHPPQVENCPDPADLATPRGSPGILSLPQRQGRSSQRSKKHRRRSTVQNEMLTRWWRKLHFSEARAMIWALNAVFGHASIWLLGVSVPGALPLKTPK